MDVQPPVLLTIGYVVLLLVIAAGLERLARHAADRSARYRTAGFTYRPQHDHWVCPRDEPLWPYEVDRQHRLVRYRARPSVCNACPVKADCTTSPDGREIVRTVDPWPHSEAGRFHRAVSVTLVCVAAGFLVAATVAWHRPADLAAELPVAGLTGWLLWYWGRDMLRTPSGFPDQVERLPATAAARGGAGAPRTGTTWSFDRRRERP